MASRFTIFVYPSGKRVENSGFVSVFLDNVSDHKVTVDFASFFRLGVNMSTVDYTVTVGSKVLSVKSSEIESKKGQGWPRFIEANEVGQNMEVIVHMTLVKENILDEAVGGVSLASWQLGKRSEAENLQKLEQKLKQNLNDELNKLDQKINLKFEDLKEDIKAPARAPECPICFEELKPPMHIIQCLKGHKLCEPCSQKPDIVSCPGACKSAFMGRDFGMEAFLLEQFQIRWVVKTELVLALQ